MTRKECAVDGLTFTKLLAANGAFNATLDWIFATVPIFMVVQSRSLDARSRKAVWFLIMLAMAGSVVSIIRIPFTKDYQFSPELWHKCLRISIISLTETTIGTIAVSMAAMKPILRPFRRFCRKLFVLTISASSNTKRNRPSDRDLEGGAAEEPQGTGTIELDTRAMRGIGLLPNSTVGGGDDESYDKSSRSYTTKTNTTTITTSMFFSTEAGSPRRERLLSIDEVSPKEEDGTSIATIAQGGRNVHDTI
ncbi:hypothetical protein KVT40_008679 [Elsinoe batatas]|uniref:Rhodopsin domain-containing protein n=1 Tax=Elsinoe batatas TaxID=2601811 RepID=A0A8K0KW52_9PEZI|nr:hypothetical protein KVT40_008679 [Elsinoe batatas]